jgi:hypothetical protein
MAALVLVVLVALPRCAAGQIDVSGRWHFHQTDSSFLVTSERAMTLTQSGSVVSVEQPAAYTAGVIDPGTGALHLDGSGQCVDFFIGQVTVIPWTIDAVVAADGQSMTGTFHESIQPTRSCFLIDGTVQAERVPELCGNGVVDAGEVCDGGLSGDACCSVFCTPIEAGTLCAADGGCGSSTCDGAGACVAHPSPAGTLCRLASGACDTPELCDGASTDCPPPSSPTQPDVDGDGIWDPCDSCVAALEDTTARFGSFTGTSAARAFVQLSGRVRLPAGEGLTDPSQTWKFIQLTGSNLPSGFGASVPPGLWNASAGRGWMRRGDRWLFRSAQPVDGIVSRMTIAPVAGDPNAYLVRIRTPRATFSPYKPQLPLSLEIILDGYGPSTQCGQATLSARGGPSPACTEHGPVLSCR